MSWSGLSWQHVLAGVIGGLTSAAIRRLLRRWRERRAVRWERIPAEHLCGCDIEHKSRGTHDARCPVTHARRRGQSTVLVSTRGSNAPESE